MISKNWTASQTETTPRRDNLQQSRIFIQRNGLCFLSWMITKNFDSVSKRDNPKKRQSPAKQDLHSKNGLCFLQLDDYQKFDIVSKRDIKHFKKRQSPASPEE
ncbi:hypothetical protein CDAR_89461 [Caerostris darwini]|uniref:Ycf1 n=1 Tax=Caerostris darwini TaxID=1538125 RepID=A0AAV4N5N8_9ARAC|nr:hypothetical protein CDAR_89461 [Caerostris darwini]